MNVSLITVLHVQIVNKELIYFIYNYYDTKMFKLSNMTKSYNTDHDILQNKKDTYFLVFL